MQDARVEQWLTRKRYKWRYEEQLRFDQISRDANPARWTAEVDVDRAVGIAIAIEAGFKMPAIVCCETHTSLFALLTGRHRIEGCQLAKPAINTLPAYIVEDVLDEFEMAKLPMALNCIEGRAPDHPMRLDQAAHLTLMFPDRSRKEIASDFGLRVREIEAHIQLVHALERAVDQGVGNDMRKLPNDQLRIQVAGLKLSQVFKRAVESLAFTEMRGTAARGFIKDLEACTSEDMALALIDDVNEKHREELRRRERQGRKPVQTPAQKWRGRVKSAVTCFPETVEQLGLGAHSLDFLNDLDGILKDMRGQCNQAIDRIADLRVQHERKHRKDGEAPSVRPSPPA